MSRENTKMVTWVSVKSFVMGCLITAFLFLSLGNLGNMESNVDPKPAHLLNRFIQTTITSRKQFVKIADYGQPGNVLNGSKALLTRVRNQVEKPFGSVPPFVLVTGERSSPCISPRGNNVMMKSYKNKVDYCNLHGCKVWYALEVWQKGFVGTWVRYPLLIHLMKANPSVTWFMWMDSDAVFTDFNFSIPFETYSSWNKNLIVPGSWEKIYGEDPDWIGLNAGIFLIRNCEWSHKFLEKWMELGAPENLMASKKALNKVVKSRPKEWDPDDQSALVYLLNQNKTKSEDNVFLEASYVLHGYFEYIIDRFEDFLEGKEKQPFITHFSGCNFCGKENITERCSEGFERAFNFADNQLLSSSNCR
ncbi:probable xyloglucan 6-xylosyltransferase 1 isoform X2 [Cryptomeria japonica]|uniref:probable xyloglucan 6-xylosyltransferase 1 isoform X2 n=1 Tax=Cryptomeria japonica TaxID=3369 RepID=UPI0027DA7EB1|nr:probable xyloglucan 6-xylosyltransferase 1 isoform X2 [Cryptomeria japonica]